MIMKLPVIDQRVGKKICEQLNMAFGNNFTQVIIGGAALNQEAEAFFKKVGFRYTIGYGMTECGPIISYASWDKNRLFSCGKAAPRMEIRIESEDPQNIVGEILTRGDNVMMGYFKNKEATKEMIDKEGWLHTGDMGLLDKDGYLYIKGRCKNMILGASGQNIYPEEIEDRINNMPYVNESLLIDHSGKLTALIYPDFEQLNKNGITAEVAMEENRVTLNALLPAYCQIAKVKIYPEEFEKTPKRSIKRYLYQPKSLEL
jgi:long-chain acyl-CoA synthetase